MNTPTPVGVFFLSVGILTAGITIQDNLFKNF